MPWKDSRISRMPRPTDRATSGSRLGPSTISASMAMNTSSMGDGERNAISMRSG